MYTHPDVTMLLPQARPGEGDRPYSDLEVVRELRAMANTAKREGQQTSAVQCTALHCKSPLTQCSCTKAITDGVTGKRRQDGQPRK